MNNFSYMLFLFEAEKLAVKIHHREDFWCPFFNTLPLETNALHHSVQHLLNGIHVQLRMD